MANPSMVATNMQVLRSYDGDGNLQRIVKPAAAQEALFANGAIPAGRCMSLNSSGESELGVTGRRVPLWIFRRSNSPSGGWSGEAVASSSDLTWADGSNHAFLHFVGIEGLEIATTEFIDGQTYTLNTLLSARMSDNAAYSTDAQRAAGAGVVYSTGVVHGAHPVVGVVSRTGYERFNRNYVTFYTLYRPPVEGLINGTPVNVTAP
jgi:hypothetical protein